MSKGDKEPRGRKRKHSQSPVSSAKSAQEGTEKEDEGSLTPQYDSSLEMEKLEDTSAQDDRKIEDQKEIERLNKEIERLDKESERLDKESEEQKKGIERLNKDSELRNKVYHKESLDIFVQKSLHLEDSINYIKAHGTDDHATVKFLFDVSSVKDVHERILLLDSHLARKNDERCYESVGRLLIGANLFCMKAFDFPEPFIPPTEITNSTHDEVIFDLEIENCRTDLGPLMDIFESTDKWKDLLVPMHTMYIQDHFGDPCESQIAANRYVRIVLYHLVDFLDIIRSSSYLVSEQGRYLINCIGSSYISPNGYICINGKIEMILEFKLCSMLPTQRFDGPNEINVEVSDLMGSFKQTFCYMLEIGCPRVLWSDGQNSIFLLFDYEKAHLNKESWKRQGKAIIPLRVFSSNIKSVAPSFLESNLAWMLRSEMETVDEYKMKELKEFYITMRKRLSPPRRVANNEHTNEIPSVYIDYGEATSITSGYSAFQIFKVDADKVSSAGHNLNSEEQVVVKIFDDNDFFDYWPRAKLGMPLPIYMEESYQGERMCIDRLLEDPEFNNCYFKHDEVEVMVNVGLWDAVGKCILSRFIDKIELPKDDETYKKAKQQLDIIHKHGIIHDDIKSDNILYSKEGTVYIIDFGVSHIINSKHQEYYANDNQCLWNIFYRWK